MTTPITPLHFPEPLGEADVDAYHALRRQAGWIESVSRWSSIVGPKAADALNGLVTNDVLNVAVGSGCHALALSPKGKMVCDMLIIRVADDAFHITVLASAADAWLELARKYINPRLAKVTDETASWNTWMLYGAESAMAVARVGGGSHTNDDLTQGMASNLAAWPEWQHEAWNIGPASVRIIAGPHMGSIPGFIIRADPLDAELVRRRLESSGCPHASRDVWNILRVEGGRPAMGIDMDENTIPQEANLDAAGAISFTKGCYTGQETVARVHFRGHVNRHLRGLMAESPLPQNGRVLDATGKDVGDVRSSVISPRLGPIAMAMVRREVEPGSVVTVEGIPSTLFTLPSSL